MANNPFGGFDPAEEKKYILSCKLKFFKKAIEDFNDKKEKIVRQRTLALLIPQETDEVYKFFAAWLPDTKEEHHEVVTYIGHPIHSTCRMAVKRGPDEKSDRPYLTVMNVGVEEEMLRNMQPGQAMIVTVLPASEDSEADFAKDSDQYR